MHRFRFTIAIAALVAALLGSSAMSLAAANAREGCLNQWLFNGVWRVQVTHVDPLMDGGQLVGWRVTEIWRNGTDQNVAPFDSFYLDQALELKNGGTVTASSSTRGTLSAGEVAAHTFPPSGQFTHVQLFYMSGTVDPNDKPSALDVTFDAAKLAQAKSKPQFTSSLYNFRFKLECVANGAAAQAQGGSSEVAGTQGCLNQWMTNGVWKMRATVVGSDQNSDPSAPQIGWAITEDWVNLSNRPLAPGDTNVTDQQLVLASGNTVSSTNTAGTSMNQNQLMYHTFPPGGSFTYQQLFRPSPFSLTDKPTRLIVTFDAKKEQLSTHMPQYKVNPPNFRISFDCTR